MYFQIQDKITQLKLEDIDGDKITIGLISIEELKKRTAILVLQNLQF